MKKRVLLVCAIGALVALAGGAGGLYAYDASRSDVIAHGVSVAGVDLGGLRRDAAAKRLSERLAPRLERPLLVAHGTRTWTLTARDAGVRADVERMVGAALRRSRDGGFFGRALRELSGNDVSARLPARVIVSRQAVSSLVDRIARQLDRPARDAAVQPSGVSLDVSPSRDGLAVQKRRLAFRILRQLRDPSSPHAVTVPVRPLRPKVTTAGLATRYPYFITIERSQFQLRLWDHLRLRKTYTIAVGRIGLETPAGLYHIQDKAVDPAWHVPNRAWAGSLAGQVIPGGSPDNPLKARWMGIYNGAGIHGTDDLSSLGTAASHGCIRMSIPDVIELYSIVPVGTPVYIA
jgi:lipoprotein-anchoring transpeptidase ErfK/SrfK